MQLTWLEINYNNDDDNDDESDDYSYFFGRITTDDLSSRTLPTATATTDSESGMGTMPVVMR